MLLSCLLPQSAPAADKPLVPKPAPAAPATNPSARWEKEIAAYEAADRKAPPPQGAILFVGSSSIRKWTTLAQDFPGRQVINRGFGGSFMFDSVYYADRIVIPYKPKLIVIHAGGNDINAGRSPEQVLADFRAFVQKVRAKLPDVRIAYMGIHPSPKRWAQAEKEKKSNQLLRDYTATVKGLDYIDVWDAMLGPDGKPRPELFVADKLHNNAEGYKVRTAQTEPHLN